MNLRLQTSSKPALEVLKEGLQEMTEICDLLDYKVDEALNEYLSREGTAAAAEPN